MNIANPDLLPERIRDKIEIREDGCWIWTAYCNSDGYGSVKYDGSMRYSHRVVYELLVGPINKPALHHRCYMRPCCNPAHLYPCTQGENILDEGSTSASAVNFRKTHCLKGHPFSGNNLHIKPNGTRSCKACQKERNRARYCKP